MVILAVSLEGNIRNSMTEQSVLFSFEFCKIFLLKELFRKLAALLDRSLYEYEIPVGISPWSTYYDR